MGQEGIETQRRKFSTECDRAAVAMLDTRGIPVSQIAAELEITADVLRQRRELRQKANQMFRG
jgi:transposase-like protein